MVKILFFSKKYNFFSNIVLKLAFKVYIGNKASMKNMYVFSKYTVLYVSKFAPAVYLNYSKSTTLEALAIAPNVNYK